ncbi:conserved hypothetical protein [Burkholderia ambifaria IOP40-10]|uniref:Uncharacterized protein n=1 Tax=Burkholderia ambifaria IOP40-10 TaxID=396596 RepID=B1FED5_9BURK|nr:conserved hypothetical protein [Burkholderia ambifaria IOP40-10]
MRQVGLDATRRAARGRIEWLEGSHLFPMERPIETARALQRMLNSLKATEGGVPRDSVALAKRA